MAAEFGRLRIIQDFVKRSILNIPKRRMKETRTICPIRLDNRGNPGGVAARCDGFRLTTASSEMGNNATQLFRAFCNEAAADLRGKFSNQRFDFAMKLFHLLGIQSYLRLTGQRPSSPAVKSL